MLDQRRRWQVNIIPIWVDASFLVGPYWEPSKHKHLCGRYVYCFNKRSLNPRMVFIGKNDLIKEFFLTKELTVALCITEVFTIYFH